MERPGIFARPRIKWLESKHKSQSLNKKSEGGQFVRLSETERPEITIHVNGEAVTALAGDTVLTALMMVGTAVREFEFGAGARAGFCLMGACQDCWVKQEEGGSLRACSTYVREGLRLITDGGEQ
ncbi:MAG: (2Fe-2S)-binding protein [Rhodospirillaceae bacterium]|nr:(2Fe-2S)-binding protein [Rhodospirillaceae bacterium]